ncbi:LysR family transcriptional regulator [Shewanella sp. SR44-3]|uniref:LysR family transcriptional regulator n=1 Tax=Shewanella sp. SR44-3 TaxID=2760936 RepID=UPI0015F7CFB2|nr:LysR family transcriptional regulator [Shewanella sp. SR44-3]MBB1268133.1 LysR family transcriptional regulator [Shewanella sp. SR44-3]
MKINFKQMSLFAAVVESGSITAAAEQLGMAKSVLSQHLKNLEQQLGVVLLKRTTRRQQLTAAGSRFYVSCKQLNDIASTAWQTAQESSLKAAGKITISAPHALMNIIIAPAMAALCMQFPDIELQLIAEDKRLNLSDHGIDIAVRVGKLASSNLMQQKLGEFRDSLCASRSFYERHQTALNLDKYLQERFATIVDKPYAHDAKALISDTKNQASDAVKPTPDSIRLNCPYIANDWQGNAPSHELTHIKTGHRLIINAKASAQVNSLPTLLALAKSGAGIALIPDFILADQDAGDLSGIFSDYQGKTNPIYAIHDFGQHTPHLVSLCIKQIKNHLRRLTKKEP